VEPPAEQLDEWVEQLAACAAMEPLVDVLAATAHAAMAAQQQPSSQAAMASLQALLDAMKPRIPAFEAKNLMLLLVVLRPLADEAAAAGGADAAEALDYLSSYAGQVLELAAVDYSQLGPKELLLVVSFASISQMVRPGAPSLEESARRPPGMLRGAAVSLQAARPPCAVCAQQCHSGALGQRGPAACAQLPLPAPAAARPREQIAAGAFP
jgi:hypothetical protein